jgi:phosphoribosyl 1,2-cyclic phosphate phosphodiesterase
MEFIILGSGGCVALPKPLCKCRVCEEAREKGNPYSRFGCSIFFKDLNMLVDTPEDIVHSLNFFNIEEIETVLYSHMDPDHTLGMRVFEQLRLNWFDVFEGKTCTNPIKVIAMEHVMKDLNHIRSKYGSFLDYYEKARNLIKRDIVNDSIILKDIKISFISAGIATVFVFEKDLKKVIYAPCDVKPFPENKIFEKANYMIIGNTVVGNILKDGYELKEGNPLNEELFNMEEILKLKNKFNIDKVIITHLEEDWGKSYDDYLKLEQEYSNIFFAYDGMKIKL